ncbi:hydroxymethylglutaryl-CoA lyase [Sphingomonas sp. UYEF23]|uniref:hydroxymethylglutaryl-CoA lyase n=1 Tax=Sphingomonas sp. UYEF23 TaxID=1756408 RepID=UPI003398B335
MIEIVEVSARDGLQNEREQFSTAQKIALITRMVAAGAHRLEVASFVRADRVPQMADAEAVIDGLDLHENVTTIGLVMNLRGLERALRTAIKEIGAVCVATDSFARANQGQTSRESAQVAARVVQEATSAGRRAQVTIGAAFGCPFDGEVDPERVIAIARELATAGPVEIAIADTIGVAVPRQVRSLVTELREATGLPIRVHLHNTRGTAIANAWAAIEAGASTLDGSVGGIGGCPFAPKATGNMATEDLVYLCDRSGVKTGYDLTKTIDAAYWLGEQMGRPLPGSVSRSGGFPA